ncbi:MAG: hypothetical protein QOH40_2 [Arthrobacter pascens]|nr:hypothetical protein [Arthrobacter pascens]
MLKFIATLFGESELLAARACLVVLPRVLNEALVFQSLQKGVQGSALEAGEAVLPQELCDGIAMAIPMGERPEHCLRERCADQLLVKVDVIHE